MSSGKIPVIYIVGSSHSGSTLLDLMLGSHSRIESVGEISKLPLIFSMPTRSKRQCTCGAPVDECAYWKEINQIVDLKNIGDINERHSFERKNSALIKAILEVSGKSVFCDSSKTIGRLENYLGSDLFAVTIVHLVRDGRAVSYSNASKKKRLLEKTGNKQAYRKWLEAKKKSDKQFTAVYSLLLWKHTNTKCLKEFSRYPGYQVMRYEDLAKDPEFQVRCITDAVGLTLEKNQLRFFENEHHNLAGNRMRHQGAQVIDRDVRYLKKLSFMKWWMSTLYLLPLLRRFGYPLSRQ